mgnify:CR=1 FL=1
MSKLFGYERGLFNYVLGVLTSVTGFLSMYIFGGIFMSLLSGFQAFRNSGDVANAVIAYVFSEALPPTSIQSVITQSVVGAIIAGLLWYKGVKSS